MKLFRSTIASLAAATAALLALTACNSDSDDDDYSQTVRFTETYTQCFSAVTDLQDNAVTLRDGAKYTFSCEVKSATEAYMQMSVVGLELSDDIPFTSFTLPVLEMKVNAKDEYEPYSVTAAKATPNGAAGVAMELTDLNVRMLRRMKGQDYMPVYAVSFTVNNRYAVTVFAKINYFFGETTSVNEATQAPFVSSDPFYTLTLDPAAATARMDIEGAKFLQNMPAMDMAFKDIPFSVADGRVVLDCPSLVPEIKDVPFPQYPISDVEGYVDPCNGGYFAFTCDVTTLSSTYRVTALLTDMPQ